MAQLADLIRKKYPGDYDDLDDDELESKVLKKYPEYEDIAKPRETPVLLKAQGSSETDKLLKEAKTSLSKPAPWENEENIPEEPQKPKTSTDVKTKSESDNRSLSSRFADSISSVLDKGSDFINRHPKLREAWEGPVRDPEHPLVGPGGLSNIPGVKKAGDWIANKIDPTDAREDRGIIRPFLAGAVQGATGNILAHPLEFSEIGPNAPPRIPKERGLPAGPSDFGPSSGRDVFDASFKAESIPAVRQRQSAEVPYRQEPTVPPVRPPRDYAGPTRTPEAPIDLAPPKPPVPAASAKKPGYVDNAQTEFTNAKGEISLRQPTPDRVAQLQDDGYTVTRTLPSGAVIMSPPAKKTTVAEVKKAVNPFAKAPTEAAPIAEVPRPEPIPEPIPEPSPTQQFAQSIEPDPNIFSGITPSQESQTPEPFISPEETVLAKNDQIPELTPPEFHPVDAPVADDIFAEQTRTFDEDKLYNLARNKMNMGFSEDAPLQEATQSKEDFANSIRNAYGEPEEDIFASAPKRQENLTPALADESVMDYHRRTGASIADSTRAVEGEDIEPSFARRPKESYTDLTPERHKRYHVYDENDNLIDKTYDSQEAQKWADQNNGYVKDIGESNEPSFSRKPYQGHDEKIVQNIANETNPQIVKDNAKEWRDRARTLEFEGNLPEAARAREISKVAYQRLEDLLGNPDNEPKYARTESGGVKMSIGDPTEMIKIFRNTYSGSIPHVATKELIQNAIDAAAHLGKEGDVKVNVDEPSHTITVSDNGKGMSREDLETVFTDLSSSGKRGGSEKTIGELGVGKTTYMVAGEHVSVETISKDPHTGELRGYILEGTPEELFEDVLVEEFKPEKGATTGTTVKLKAPSDSQYSDLTRYLDALSKYSNNPVPITINKKGAYSWENIDNLKVAPKSQMGGKKIGDVHVPGSTNAVITIPKDASYNPTDRIALVLNNRGMFQGVDSYYIGKMVEAPSHVIVDLDPLVPGTDQKYPLTAPTRERLKYEAKNRIGDFIKKEIVDAAIDKRTAELGRIFDKLKGKSTGMTIHDGGEKYTPQEIKKIKENIPMNVISNVIKNMVKDLLEVIPPSSSSSEVSRIGFVFDNLRGVNLRNPLNHNEYIILVNPFAEFMRNTPMQAAQGIVHTLIHEYTHVDIRNEGDDFTAHLATIYEKFALESQLAYRKKIEKAISPDGQNYTPEIQELLREYTESRGRESTSEDLLLREAGSYVLGPQESGEPSFSRESDGKRTPRRKRGKKRDVAGAVEKLLEGLQEAHGSREAQAEINKKTRAERFAAFSGVKTEGMKGAAQSLGKLRGEFEKVDISGFEDYLDEDQIDSLFNAVKYAVITPAEKARGYTALFSLLQGGNVPSRSDLAVLDEVFGGGFSNKIIEMHSGLPIKLTKVANTMKALRSSFDLSAPLRQGMALWMKPEYRKALASMFKFMLNPEAYHAAMQSIHDDKDYLASREAGLFIAKPDDLVDGEEAFMNTYIPELGALIPGLKQGVKMSERAYTGFLNVLRFEIFKSLMNSLRDSGIQPYTVTHEIDPDTGEKMEAAITTSKALDDVAKFINVATGRGSLGRLEKMAPELNAVIWSPRLLASRLQMLNPMYYKGLEPVARMEALKALFGIATAGLIITGLFYLRGRKVSLNPTTADFLKARKGNNVVDAWTGYQQEIVAAARLAAGESNGRPKVRTETMEQFLTQKLSPIAALAYEVGSAKKFDKKHPGVFTNKFSQQKNISTEIVNSFVPMFVQDAVEMSKQDLPFAEKVGLDALSMFGMGVQNYPESNTKGKSKGISKPSIR